MSQTDAGRFAVLLFSTDHSPYYDSGRKLAFFLGKDRCWSYPDLKTGVQAVRRLLADIIEFQEKNRESRAHSPTWFVNQQKPSSADWNRAIAGDGVVVVIDPDTFKVNVHQMFRRRYLASPHVMGFPDIGAPLPPQAASPDFPFEELFELASLE